MSVTDQIRMANQIAIQFGYLSDAEAATAVAGHIRQFWDPRMRRQLFTQVDTDPSDLEPIVIKAVGELRG